MYIEFNDKLSKDKSNLSQIITWSIGQYFYFWKKGNFYTQLRIRVKPIDLLGKKNLPVEHFNTD